jgi:hypothetical protein
LRHYYHHHNEHHDFDEHDEHFDYDSHNLNDDEHFDYDSHNLDDAAADSGLHPGYPLCGWPRALLCQRQRCGDDLCLRCRGILCFWRLRILFYLTSLRESA